MATAVEVLEQIPDVRAVTADGDLIGPDWAVGGSAGGQSMLEIQATRDRAAAELTATRQRIDELERRAGRCHRGGRAGEPKPRPARWPRCTIRTPGCPPSPRNSPGSVRRPGRPRRRPTGWPGSSRPPKSRCEQHRTTLSDLENRLYAAESEEAPDEVDPQERDALAERTSFARQREVEARLVQRTAEERARATEGNAESLRRAARQERQHRLRVAAAEATAHRQFGGRDQGRRGRPPGRRATGTIAGRRGRRT